MAGAKRSYGSGSIYVRTDAAGVDRFYGSWRANGRHVNRLLGVKRARGSREGLTAKQAEEKLRLLIAETAPRAALGDRLTLSEVGVRYRAHLEVQGRKRSTRAAVESVFRVWLDPQLGDRSLDSITLQDCEDLMRSMMAAGVGPKSVRNYIGTLSAVFKFAMSRQRRWASANPCEDLELPKREDGEELPAFLSVLEVEALIGAAVEGEHQALDRALYATAAMTGLRQGELLALAWGDVDWIARRVRVRRAHVLGEFTTPKSRRSTRSVPMNMRVARELDQWHQASAWDGPGALVFAEPSTGEVLARGALMRRYRRALKAAQLDPAHRFHDLRHTFGTAMASAGVPMRTLQELMGHQQPSTTAIYAHYAPNAQEVEMADRAFADPLAEPLSEQSGANEVPI